MPVDQSCIEAMFNYTTVILNMLENREDMRSADNVREYAGSLLSANVSARLVDYWAKEVGVRCEVKIDEAMVEAIIDDEKQMLAPDLIGILREIGRSEAEIRAEMEAKKSEAGRAMYG